LLEVAKQQVALCYCGITFAHGLHDSAVVTLAFVDAPLVMYIQSQAKVPSVYHRLEADWIREEGLVPIIALAGATGAICCWVEAFPGVPVGVEHKRMQGEGVLIEPVKNLGL
jgi:hypothetical protein